MFKSTSAPKPNLNVKKVVVQSESKELKKKKKSALSEQISKVLEETKTGSRSQVSDSKRESMKIRTPDDLSSDSDDDLPEDVKKDNEIESKVPKRTKLGDLSEEERVNRHREQMKEWRDKNPTYSKTYRQKYYAEHREEILEKRRLKRLEEKKNLEEFKAYKANLAK